MPISKGCRDYVHELIYMKDWEQCLAHGECWRSVKKERAFSPANTEVTLVPASLCWVPTTCQAYLRTPHTCSTHTSHSNESRQKWWFILLYRLGRWRFRVAPWHAWDASFRRKSSVSLHTPCPAHDIVRYALDDFGPLTMKAIGKLQEKWCPWSCDKKWSFFTVQRASN